MLVNFGPLFPPSLQIYLDRLIARQNHVVDVMRVSVITAPVESVQSEYSEFLQPAAARLASVMLRLEAETLDLRRRRQRRRFERLNTSM